MFVKSREPENPVPPQQAQQQAPQAKRPAGRNGVPSIISADLIVTPTGSGELSNSAASLASAVPGVTATTTVYGGQFEFRSSLESILGLGTENLSKTVILNMTAGTSAALTAGVGSATAATLFAEELALPSSTTPTATVRPRPTVANV